MTTDQGPDPAVTDAAGSDTPESTIETARTATPPAADAGTDAGDAASDAAASDASATAAPSPQRRHRKARAAAQVVGIVGIVVSVALAVVILFVHAQVSEGINGVFDTADRQIERGATIVGVATDRVQERVSDIDDFIATVSAITPGSNLPPALAERATSIADRYDAVRNQFAELRARVESALETVRQVARLVPFIDLPTGPTEELAALDAKLQQFDDALSQLREGSLASAVIDRVVQGATTLRGTIDDIAGLGERVQTRLAEAQQRLDQANARVDGILWLVTVILLLLVAYVAVLNALVIWLARR